MKVTREKVVENRRRILDSASQLFRSRGIDSVTVAEVMQCAGLTHGGFYRHFASKNDLVAQALGHSMKADIDRPFDLPGYIDSYLSSHHRDNPGLGCPTAALASEMRRQNPQARAVMSSGAHLVLGTIADAVSAPVAAKGRQAAIGSWAAMVGAIIIARAVDDRKLSDEILEETRRFILSAMK